MYLPCTIPNQFSKTKIYFLLFLSLTYLFCDANQKDEMLREMNCNESSNSTAFSDSMTIYGEVIVSNLKKLDLNTGIKNKLIASYSSDTKNNIAYSINFCHTYNNLIAIIKKCDKDRRQNSGLDDEQRSSAEISYRETLDSLRNLLLDGIKQEINYQAPSTNEIKIQTTKAIPASRKKIKLIIR
jgi:hypothetical protein